MNYREARDEVADRLARGGQPLREALMMALDRLPTNSNHGVECPVGGCERCEGAWQDDVVDLFTGVPASIFWEIDGLDSTPAYSRPPIRGDRSVCRPPSAWLHKLRSVRNSRSDLFDVLKRG